jgi:hypothetical protein
MAERTSQNWKDEQEMPLEELLKLPPDELLAVLREEALRADDIWLPPADHRYLSRVVDIYATEVRPLEERYYEWLRGLRDLAREGKWEQIDPELRAFARKLLRVLRDQPAAPGAAATAEAPPSTTTPGSEAQVPAEPQATAQKGAEGKASVRVRRKTKARTEGEATPQQAEPAGPEPAGAAEAPEQPTVSRPPEPAPTTPAAEEGVAPTGAEAAAPHPPKLLPPPRSCT